LNQKFPRRIALKMSVQNLDVLFAPFTSHFFDLNLPQRRFISLRFVT